MAENRLFRVVYPFGEGEYALPEEQLDTFYMEVQARYEQVVRSFNTIYEPSIIPQPDQQRRSEEG